MKISAKAQYACIATLRLAQSYREQQPVHVKAIAEAHGISQQFLVQILLQLKAAGLDGRIRLVQGYVPGLALDERSFDAILSKDFLHHLPDPDALWAEARRLGRPGAAVFVMDLVRPDTPQAARAIVEAVAANEHPLLKEDFYNSLCAAFTVAEAAEQLRRAGLDLDVRQISDRHMLITGRL